MANKKPKILIAIPTFLTIHHKVVAALTSILIQNEDYEIDTYISSMRGIGEHRNKIVEDFLKTDNEWLLMIDSDNPPPTNTLELIKLDKDIISCPTPINMDWVQGVNNLYWNVFDNEGYPIKTAGMGLEEANKVGAGCILIKRRVLEEIENPFTTERDETDLRTKGTDAAFCEKATKAGFKIYTHWDYPCRHYKEIDLLSIM